MELINISSPEAARKSISTVMAHLRALDQFLQHISCQETPTLWVSLGRKHKEATSDDRETARQSWQSCSLSHWPGSAMLLHSPRWHCGGGGLLPGELEGGERPVPMHVTGALSEMDRDPGDRELCCMWCAVQAGHSTAFQPRMGADSTQSEPLISKGARYEWTRSLESMLDVQQERRGQRPKGHACQYKREEGETSTKPSSEGAWCGHPMGRSEGGETCYLAAGSGQDLQRQGHWSQPWPHHWSPKEVEWAPDMHRRSDPPEPVVFGFLSKGFKENPKLWATKSR